jgi:hypothetical protein
VIVVSAAKTSAKVVVLITWSDASVSLPTPMMFRPAKVVVPPPP